MSLENYYLLLITVFAGGAFVGMMILATITFFTRITEESEDEDENE